MRPIVRRFDIEVGRCSPCQRREQGGHSAQTSDSLGAAGVQLGRGVVALVVELHAEMGVPLARVRPPAADEVRVARDPGGLTYLHRVARDAARTYTALCAEVRNAPVVTADGKPLAVGRHPPLAVGLRHPADNGLRHLPRGPRVRRCGHGSWGRLRRRARARRLGVFCCCWRAALHQSCLNQYPDIRIMPMFHPDVPVAPGTLRNELAPMRRRPGARHRRTHCTPAMSIAAFRPRFSPAVSAFEMW